MIFIVLRYNELYVKNNIVVKLTKIKLLNCLDHFSQLISVIVLIQTLIHGGNIYFRRIKDKISFFHESKCKKKLLIENKILRQKILSGYLFTAGVLVLYGLQIQFAQYQRKFFCIR